jgi:KDO2-lipid IV(A) lauroyltransferase
MRELAYTLLSFAGTLLGWRGAHALGALLGEALWWLAPSRRHLAAEAMAVHLGMPLEQARAKARRSFRQNMRSFLELLMATRVDQRFVRERMEIADPELWERITSDKRPLVMTTGHLGAWELLSGLVRVTIPKERRQVVVRRNKDQDLHRLIVRLRSRPGVEIVDHRKAAFKVLKGLKRGGMAAFLVDHNTLRQEAVFLPFLGRTAAVTMGPALLAVRSGAAVWPGFLERLAGGRYRLHLEEPLDTTTLEGSTEDKIRATAEFYTRAMERFVLLAPEQWLWMHKRWKTRPKD